LEPKPDPQTLHEPPEPEDEEPSSSHGPPEPEPDWRRRSRRSSKPPFFNVDRVHGRLRLRNRGECTASSPHSLPRLQLDGAHGQFPCRRT